MNDFGTLNVQQTGYLFSFSPPPTKIEVKEQNQFSTNFLVVLKLLTKLGQISFKNKNELCLNLNNSSCLSEKTHNHF